MNVMRMSVLASNRNRCSIVALALWATVSCSTQDFLQDDRSPDVLETGTEKFGEVIPYDEGRDSAVADIPEVSIEDVDDVGLVDDGGDHISDVCGVEPRVDCSCTEEGVACCLETAVGLACEYVAIGGATQLVWVRFFDCGCYDGPECDGWEVFPLCDSLFWGREQ